MAALAGMPPNPPGEKLNSQVIHRQTRGGRTLWYKLTVLQEPERARACGAGTRANSDRRPVDPPPVVELKITEGGSQFGEGRDVTFDYNASFFLYASLEQSRKVIRGRVPGQPNPPILTGVPASGMAYLDRPSQAGYFIFPDLSVRHEGYYNLAFSLFETTKDEKDFDVDTGDNLPPGVDWRMDIKTNPFEVYSAKKFPGLKESTDLSKQVAEQGCRVRIRREIRMRKRDNKGNARGRRDEEISARRTVTPSEDPHSAAARARSLSNSSEHRPVYPHDPHRRPSVADGHMPRPPGPPAFDHHSQGAHLTFGHPGQSQYPAPPAPAPSQYMPTSAVPPPHIKQEPAYSSGYARPDPAALYQSRPREMHPSPSPSMRPEVQQTPNYSLNSPASMSSSSHYRRESIPSHPTTPGSSHGNSRAYAPTPQLAPMPPARTGRMSIYAMCDGADGSKTAPIEADTEPRPPPAYYPTGAKRPRDQVFSPDERALRYGARPQDPHNSVMSHFGEGSKCYKNAAGSWVEADFPRYDSRGHARV